MLHNHPHEEIAGREQENSVRKEPPRCFRCGTRINVSYNEQLKRWTCEYCVPSYKA